MASEKEKQTRSEQRSSERQQGKQANQKAAAARSEKNDQNRNQASKKSSRSGSGDKEKMQFKLQAGESATTTDHNEIRRWIEERGGNPATVGATEGDGEEQGKRDPGLLRIDFPNRGGSGRLEAISWETFFEKFDEKHLAFLYQEQTRTGRVSRFSKFVSQDTARGNAARGETEKGNSTKGTAKGKRNKAES